MHMEELDDLLKADGFNEAIIGVAERCGQENTVAYDADKCMAILESQGMEPDEAREYFYFNVAGSYVGEQTPTFIHRTPSPSP